MPYSAGTHVYDITVAQFSQQILPAGLPPTTVWSYGATADLRTVPDGGTLNYPARSRSSR